jgi:hypothetical protein
VTAEVGIPDVLDGVPATGKLVYVALDHADRPLTTAEIATTMRLPERSVRSGLADLDRENLLCTDGDPVTPAYTLTDSHRQQTDGEYSGEEPHDRQSQ